MTDLYERLGTIALDYRKARVPLTMMVEQRGLMGGLETVDRERLVQYLSSRSDLVDAWLDYSCDKRAPGYFLSQEGAQYQLGRVSIDGGIECIQRFTDPARACAEFILLEIDDIRSS